jgi:predicted DNA-binding protein with PD1-like motif
MLTKKMEEYVAARLEAGEEVLASLHELADKYEIGFATIQAIGALQSATLGYFDPSDKEYHQIPVDEQVEVTALSGNISRLEDGQPFAHIHALLSRANGETLGGHLSEGIVRPTLEIVLTLLPGEVVRRKDPLSDLNLWSL